MTIRFVSIDLLLEGAGLAELLEAWDGQVLVLHRTRSTVTLELARQPRSEEAAIATYQRMIRALPPELRARWQRLRTRVFDIGFERTARKGRGAPTPAPDPAVLSVLLSRATIAAVAEVGAAVVVTVYPPS